MFSKAAVSQAATDSVKQVVDLMFNAMKHADTVTLASLFTADAQLHTVAVTKDGNTVVRTDRIGDFVAAVGRMPEGDADERIRFEAVHIDGALASVWTPYQFYYKGAFSHCGVNSFQLVRLNGVWKIHFVIDTRRKTGCD
jgi:hypothetical protein